MLRRRLFNLENVDFLVVRESDRFTLDVVNIEIDNPDSELDNLDNHQI
jgi:hypothetical protein